MNQNGVRQNIDMGLSYYFFLRCIIVTLMLKVNIFIKTRSCSKQSHCFTTTHDGNYKMKEGKLVIKKKKKHKDEKW